MTSKTLYFNLMKEDAKRRLWLLALTVLAFFFLFPVAVAIKVSQDNGEQLYYLATEITSIFTVKNGMTFFLVITGSLIWGVTGFSYLHSKQKVDFYHCLPVRREKLFLVQFFNGLLIFAGAYLINMLLGMAVAGVNGLLRPEAVALAFQTFGFYMVNYLLLYSVVILAMMLTGNTVVGIVGVVVLNFYLPSLLVLLTGYFMSFFQNCYHMGDTLITKLLQYSSPLIIAFGNWDVYESLGSFPVLRVVLTCCLGVGITLLSLWVYRQRKSEAAGRAMAFKAVQTVVRIPIVLLSALAGGIFFWILHSNMGWVLFGLLCGLLLSHCVIEIIYHYDFKKLFSHKLQMVLCGLAALAVFVVFRYDVFGYDRYVPKESQIQSASIWIPKMASWVEYGEPAREPSGEAYWQWRDGSTYVFEHMQLQQYDELLPIVREAIRQSQSSRDGNGNTGTETWWESGYGRISVQYVLKNGRKVSRSYYVNMNTMVEPLRELYVDNAYKMGTYPLLSERAEDIAYADAMAGGKAQCLYQKQAVGTEEEMKVLLETYQEELNNLSLDTMLREMPVAAVGFMDSAVYRYALEEGQDRKVDWEQYMYRYPVYPSFHKTLRLLEDYGLRGISAKDVNQIIFDTGNYSYRGDAEAEAEYDGIIITDREQIEEIMRDAVCRDYLYMNPFCSGCDGLEMRVLFGSGLDLDERLYILPQESVPEYLKKQLN